MTTTNKIMEDAAGPAPDAKQPAGRVEFDSRGNSVWRWAREVLDSTSILLKRLDNTDLALEPTEKLPVARGTVKKSAQPAEKLSVVEPKGRSFDPYNSR